MIIINSVIIQINFSFSIHRRSHHLHNGKYNHIDHIFCTKLLYRYNHTTYKLSIQCEIRCGLAQLATVYTQSFLNYQNKAHSLEYRLGCIVPRSMNSLSLLPILASLAKASSSSFCLSALSFKIWDDVYFDFASYCATHSASF